MSNGHDMTKEGIEAFLYMIESVPVAPKEQIMALLPKHLERQVDLEKKGVLFAAGPIFNEGSEAPNAGLTIIRASSFDEARKIADDDPMHQQGLREYTIRRWSLNEGSYQVTINYSTRSASIV